MAARYPEDQSPLRSELPEFDPAFARLREDFLVGFRLNTARAYWGDLEHLSGWQQARGSTLLALTETDLFRYVRSLTGDGYSPGTVRRRLTCLRAFVAHVGRVGRPMQVDVDRVADRLNSLAASNIDAGTTSVLIMSDDILVRRGLRESLYLEGIVDTAEVVTSDIQNVDDQRALPRCDYAVFHLFPGSQNDRYSGLSALRSIIRAQLATTSIVMASFVVPRLLKLRLAEDGCNFVYPYGLLASSPARLAHELRTGAVNEEYQLPTQWALRESLGLRWNGALEPFLELAAAAPLQLWMSNRPISTLPVDRGVVRDLQAQARDVAGLPPPDFRRYASSVRRAPELPLWPAVRDFVRGLWGHPT